jgi:hypothetical protein
MSYLVISVTNATDAQKNLITKYLGLLGAYWHWMPDIWLVNTNVNVSIADVRDRISKILPSIISLVLEVEVPDPGAWVGMFPEDQADKWAEWLNAYWTPGA